MSTPISEDFALGLVLSPDIEHDFNLDAIPLEGNETQIMSVAIRAMSEAEAQHDSEKMQTIHRNLSIIQARILSTSDSELEFFSLAIHQASESIKYLEGSSIVEHIEDKLRHLPDHYDHFQFCRIMELIDKAEAKGELSPQQADVWRRTLNFIDPRSKPEQFSMEDEVFAKQVDDINKSRFKQYIQLAEKRKEITPEEAKTLLCACEKPNFLLDPEQYPKEKKILSKISSPFKGIASNTHQYNENKKTVHKDQQKQFLEMIRSDKPFSELTQELQDRFDMLPTETLSERLSRSMDSSILQSKHFATNFAFLVLELSHYSRTANREVEPYTRELYEAYDGKTDGKFSEKISEYPHLDIRNHNLGKICASAVLNVPGTFDVRFLFRMPPEEFRKHSSLIFRHVHATPTHIFSTLYKKNFEPEHLWICKNTQALVRSYTQAHDPNTPGNGGCMSNASERYRLLRDNPTLSSAEIPMGPINGAKFGHARTQVGSQLSPKAGIQTHYLGVENPQRIGFRRTEYIPFNQIKLTRSSDILDTLSKWSATGFRDSQCIFSFHCTPPNEPTGLHAINIQIDHKNQMFRVIDDNIGVIEYSSYESLKEGVISLLDSKYSGYSNPSAYFFYDSPSQPQKSGDRRTLAGVS
ncbi:MAG: hypothetical protein H7A41_07275 [Chlamydiales bacterium]|nr:hypothetical protein [Chlamydiales bacterium]